MTRIEVLFPEFCSLFADSSNIRYLEKCLPDAEFVFTSYMDEPLFVKEQPVALEIYIRSPHTWVIRRA